MSGDISSPYNEPPEPEEVECCGTWMMENEKGNLQCSVCGNELLPWRQDDDLEYKYRND